MRTPIAEDFAAIRKRVEELEAERRAMLHGEAPCPAQQSTRDGQGASRQGLLSDDWDSFFI